MLLTPSLFMTAPTIRCGPRVCRLPAPSRRLSMVRAAAEGSSSEDKPAFALTPAKPKTAYGEMLAYYLTMEPQLFKAAVEDQLQRLRHERNEKERQKRQLAENAEGAQKDAAELTLMRRMEELRATEVSATLEDLMYVSILEKFALLGIEMLPRMDGFVNVRPMSLTALTEGIHSKEALELVKEHLIGVMGPTSMAQFSNVAVKMSKFQMAQVYAASIMFGFFLRRVDKRFQLERSLGTLPLSKEDTVERLNRLFAMADATTDDDSAAPLDSTASGSASTSSSSSSSGGAGDKGPRPSEQQQEKRDLPMKKEKSALRKYVETFDQAAMVETARIVSAEGAALVERQTSAVLGDIKKLTQQIQTAVGKDVTSMEQVMERMAKAVEMDQVETVTMTVGTQRRAVLEAVAYGTFLRDVENWVQTDYGLLTPLPAPRLPGRGSLDDGDDPLVA